MAQSKSEGCEEGWYRFCFSDVLVEVRSWSNMGRIALTAVLGTSLVIEAIIPAASSQLCCYHVIDSSSLPLEVISYDMYSVVSGTSILPHSCNSYMGF
jgi:hypothetical protein